MRLEQNELAAEIVDRIMDSFYKEHHDEAAFREDLIKAVDTRLGGFFECKRRVVEALDFRLDLIQKSIATLENSNPGSEAQQGYEIIEGELESFRKHIRGMVVKTK